MSLREKAIRVLTRILFFDPRAELDEAQCRPAATAAFDAMTPPLVWYVLPDDRRDTHCGRYSIRRNDQRVREPWTCFCEGRWTDHPTLTAAQAAAEDHYLRTRYAGTKLGKMIDE